MHCLAGDWVSGAVCEYFAAYLVGHYETNKKVQLAFLFECIRIHMSVKQCNPHSMESYGNCLSTLGERTIGKG